jgi:outer membrane protein TolC
VSQGEQLNQDNFPCLPLWCFECTRVSNLSVIGFVAAVIPACMRLKALAIAPGEFVTLKMPILTGGLVASQVRQAEATALAERFQYDASEREAVRASDAAWAALTAAQRRLDANIAGLSAADTALKGVRAEYGFGLRSTIDILVADESFRAAQLSVALARADVLNAQAAVLRAVGRLGPATYF